MNDTSSNTRQESDHKHYDAYYENDDFKHHQLGDPAFVRGLIKKLGIKTGSSILDLGSGRGWYSSLFAKNGLKVTGVDLSSVGIREAEKKFGNEITWVAADACKLDYYEEFDVVFCGSFSPLAMSENIESTEAFELGKKLFSYLKDKGLFIFLWPSNLTENLSGYWMNYSLRQIKKYFLSIPNVEILGLFTTHAQLFPILGKNALSNIVTRITLLGLKIHRKNVRIVCILKKVQE